MDLSQFQAAFGTEKQCLDYLFHLRWPDGFRCPRCSFNEMWQVAEYKYKCKNCGYQSTVISGTLFQDTHISMDLWFQAAWYISTQPDKTTVSGLKDEIGVGSIHTARLLMQKIWQAMYRPQLDKLYGTVEVGTDNVYIGKKRHSLYIATELNKRKTGKIRIGEEIHSPKAVYDFIQDAIEIGSEITSKLPLQTGELARIGYSRKVSAHNYSGSRIKAIASALQREISRFPLEDSLEDYLNDYCAKINSRKTPMDFTELLQRAIQMEPQPKSGK